MKKFKFPSFILKSKISEVIDNEVKRAVDRKESEYKRKLKMIEQQHSIELDQRDKKYTDDMKALEDKCELRIKENTIEKDNVIKSLEKEIEDLYAWANKYQETYKDYLFKLNDLRKIIEKINSFVDNFLKTAGRQHQEASILQKEINFAIEKEDKEKDTMAKALRIR